MLLGAIMRVDAARYGDVDVAYAVLPLPMMLICADCC